MNGGETLKEGKNRDSAGTRDSQWTNRGKSEHQSNDSDELQSTE